MRVAVVEAEPHGQGSAALGLSHPELRATHRNEQVTPLNQCTICSEGFASFGAFDDHIVSVPSDPSFECLGVEQMHEAGWIQNVRARWMSPRTATDAARVQQRYLREAA
jgi:hypothetical protein